MILEKSGEKTHETVKTGYQPSPDLLRMERKLDAVLAECQWLRSLMQAETRDTSYHPTPESKLDF